MPSLRMTHYKSDLAKLRVMVADQRAGKLRCNHNSADIIHIDCVNEANATLKMYMFKGDLYLLGFKAGTTDYFFDEDQATKVQALNRAFGNVVSTNTGGRGANAKWTGFKSNYKALGTHGKHKDKQVGKNEFSAAITALNSYGGTSDDTTLFHVSCLIHYVSEALRFREVEGAVAKAIAEPGKLGSSFKLIDFEPVVTNWEALSMGTAPTDVKATTHLKVMHH